MTAIENNIRKDDNKDSNSAPTPKSHAAIDRNAPAGSENSLGEESVWDGRPSTKSNVVEAIDEVEPGAPS